MCSHATRIADPREVMEWMGHADLATTQNYLAFKVRGDAARRLSAGFRAGEAAEVTIDAEPSFRHAAAVLNGGGEARFAHEFRN